MSQMHRVTMFRSTLLLCTIAVQVLSDPNPNGCIESCMIYYSQRIPETLATASNGGNWHTSNSWKTNDGRGLVHEEQGQVVDGSVQMQYYRKNYSLSYSPGIAGPGVVSLVRQSYEITIHRSTVDPNGHGKSGVDEGHLPASCNDSTHDQHRPTSHPGAVATPSSTLTTDDTQDTSGNPGFTQQRPNRSHSGHGELNQDTQNAENRGFVNYPQKTADNPQIGQEKHQPGTPEFREEATTVIPKKPENTEVKGGKPRRPAPKPTKHTHSHPQSDIRTSNTVIPSISNSLFNNQQDLDPNSVDGLKNTGKVPQGNVVLSQRLEEQVNSAILQTKQSRAHSAVQGKDDSEPILKSQLIKVSRGNGAHNAKNKEDILGNATVNPSTTFAPNPNQNKDSWDVTVKPIKKSTERPIETPAQEVDSSTTTFPTDAPEVTNTPRSRWWDRITKTVKTTYTNVSNAVKDIVTPKGMNNTT